VVGKIWFYNLKILTEGRVRKYPQKSRIGKKIVSCKADIGKKQALAVYLKRKTTKNIIELGEMDGIIQGT